MNQLMPVWVCSCESFRQPRLCTFFLCLARTPCLGAYYRLDVIILHGNVSPTVFRAINHYHSRTPNIPPLIVHLIAGVVKHFPHICAESCPPLLTWWTTAAVVRSQLLEWRKLAIREWIKKDNIINEVTGRIILDATNIVYAYEFTDVFCR